MNSIKSVLHQYCLDHIHQRIETIQQQLASITESRNNETKSSVGDKYETGRAMLQLEEGKAQVQLQTSFLLLQRLLQIKPDQTNEQVETGALVYTNRGIFFLAIGIGKLVHDGKVYYGISEEAPIAKAMLRQKAGSVVQFQEKALEIKEIY